MLGQHGCPREFEMPRNKVNFCRLNYYIEIKHETMAVEYCLVLFKLKLWGVREIRGLREGL